MLSVSLNKEDQKNLERIRQNTSDPKSEKALAILLSNEGSSVPTIARRLKRHHHTIRDWLKRYMASGIDGLEREYSSGRPSFRKAKIEPFVENLIKEAPKKHGYQRSYWTVEMMRHEFEKQFKQKISTDSIKRTLKDLGYTFKRAKATLPEGSPTKEEKLSRVNEILNEVQELISQGGWDVFSVDESHFSTQAYLPRGWFKKRYPRSYCFAQKEGELFSFRCATDRGWEILLEKRKVRK